MRLDFRFQSMTSECLLIDPFADLPQPHRYDRIVGPESKILPKTLVFLKVEQVPDSGMIFVGGTLMKTCPLFVVIALCAFTLAPLPTLAEPQTSQQVKLFMAQAEKAGKLLEDGAGLANIEAVLEPGCIRIADMVATYRPVPKTNAYLRKRGWGNLIFTQIMYRLMALDWGVYERELKLAENVALGGAAREALETMQTSLDRLSTLLEAGEIFGFYEDIHRNANTVVPYYTGVIAEFEQEFLSRRKAVLARLDAGEKPGVVDPESLPPMSTHSLYYAHHQERLQGENRLDEILDCLARYDGECIGRFVTRLDSLEPSPHRDFLLRNVEVELLLFEDALAESEGDSAVQDMLQLYDREGSQILVDPYGGYDHDLHELMMLMKLVREKLNTYGNLDALRVFHTLGDAVREAAEEAAPTVSYIGADPTKLDDGDF